MNQYIDIQVALVAVAITILALLVVLVLLLRMSRQNRELIEIKALLVSNQSNNERDQNEVKTSLATLRVLTSDSERDMRQDMATQRSELSALLHQQSQSTEQRLEGMRTMLEGKLSSQFSLQQEQLERFKKELGQLTQTSEQKLEQMRKTLEERLDVLRNENTKKLEEMRVTVDEKLHATLETRLGESFKQVAGQLERVYQGLGDMQKLATGVGDLKRVLSNVKTRGIWGEAQLSMLLKDMLTPNQYAENIATVPGSKERVEFAIRLPGRESDQPCWLPIDAKFPMDRWEKLQLSLQQADAEAAEVERRNLEQYLKEQAKSIHEKYVHPPYTTEFAILFVPSEGIYAEAMLRPGLSDFLQHKYRVLLAGPSNLVAMLSSLQMGFRTLAIEQRSSEVWQVLGAVKTEFQKFGDIIGKTREKLELAQKTLSQVDTRTRAITRKLRGVEEMPEQATLTLLSDAVVGEESNDDVDNDA